MTRSKNKRAARRSMMMSRGTAKNPGPDVLTRRGRTAIFTKTESLGSFSASGAGFAVLSGFGTGTTRINPGNAFVFPWLSRLAPMYEKYRFRSLKFSAVPGNATTINGRLYMMVDTDPNDVIPADAVEVMANENAASAPVWTTFELNVDVARMNEGIPWRFTGGANAADAWEPRTSYSGTVFAFTSALSAACTWDILVTYTIEFSVEQLPNDSEEVASSSMFTVTDHTVTNCAMKNVTITDPGPIRLVESSNIPVSLAFPAPKDDASFQALDVSEAKSGTLVYSGRLSDAGVAVNTLLPGGGWNANCYAFDGTGAYLGVTSGLGGVFGSQGTNNNGTYAAGQVGKATIGFGLESLRVSYPTVRYLVGVLASAAKTAISTVGHGFTFS